MKKLFPALLFLLMFSAAGNAQTNVTGTITDPNGLPYNLGKIRADLIPTGGPQPCAGSNPCVTFQSGQTATLSSTGSFQMNLYANSIITPSGTQWQFTVTEPGVPYELGTGPQTFIFVATIPNLATVDISSGLSALAPALTHPLTPGPPGSLPRWDQILNPNQNKLLNLGGTTTSWINGIFNLSGTLSATLPVNPTCTTSANGQICFNSSIQNWHLFNGVDQFIATFPVSSAPVNGDVAGFSLIAGVYTLQDLGPVNATSGNSFLNVNLSTPLAGDVPCYDTGGPPIWPNCTPGATDTSIAGATSTYLISFSDQLTTIDHDVAGSVSVTVTLPTADTLGLNPGFVFIYSNHSTHIDSISPTTWTINGSATLPVNPNTFCRTRVNPNSATDWISDCATTGGAVQTVTASAPIVSSGGANPNISCPTCGTGSGNISGTLTSGKVPVASGPNNLVDSSITDSGGNPTRMPNGSNTATSGNFEEYTPDTGGVTAGLGLCATSNVDGTGRPKVLPCSHTATQPGAGFVGIAKSTVAAGGTVAVCWTVNCSATFDNTSVALNEAIFSTTTDGQLHDTGVQTATAGQPNFAVLGANSGVGTNALISLTGMLAQNPNGGGGNGRATQIQTNGTTTKNFANFVSANGLVVTGTNSGNTTTVTPSFTTQSAGDNTTNAATTAFVTTAVNNAIAGVNPAVAVQAATTGVLPNSPTYSNGVSGVGATLTAGSAAALVVDGYTPVLLDRILVKNQASAFQNGVYFLSTLGTGIVPYVLTRALDFDQPSDINNTGAIPVVNGTANGQTSWVVTSSVTTVGTDAITFTQFTLNPTTILTAASAAAAANKLAVSGGANRTTNYIDLPETKIIPAANCPNAVAGSGWSYATSTFTAACRAGTNNLGGALQLAPSTGGAAQFRVEIPTDWDSASQPFIRIEYGSGANTSGTVIWTVASACTKADGSVTDDPAFNSESAFASQTMAVANRAWSQSGQFTAITSGNNCVGSGGLILKVTLSGTASNVINVYQAVVTMNRLPVVQAN